MPFTLCAAGICGFIFAASEPDWREFCRAREDVGRVGAGGPGDGLAAALGSGRGPITGGDVVEGDITDGPFLNKTTLLANASTNNCVLGASERENFRYSLLFCLATTVG